MYALASVFVWLRLDDCSHKQNCPALTIHYRAEEWPVDHHPECALGYERCAHHRDGCGGGRLGAFLVHLHEALVFDLVNLERTGAHAREVGPASVEGGGHAERL